MKNKKSIFEQSKYDVVYFMEEHLENKNITLDEAKFINALCKCAVNYKFDEDINLGFGCNSSKICLFKIENNLWIIWSADDRRGFSNPKEYTNLYDACIDLIDRVFLNKINKQQYDNNKDNLLLLWTLSIDNFNTTMGNNLSKEELDDLENMDYNIKNPNKSLILK